MIDKQADDQGLLADESEMSDQVSEQGNSCHDENIIILVICYNKNKLGPTKCRWGQRKEISPNRI